MDEDEVGTVDVPEATVARLPQYLRALSTLAEAGLRTVSSEALADAVGVGSAKLRKDLSHLGSYGTRGVGYDVEQLHRQIADHLGQTTSWNVVIVGIGNLGHALAGYGGFASRGFRVVGLFDDGAHVVGEVVSGLPVRPLDDLPSVLRPGEPTIGVLAVPAEHAQVVCDRLVAAGVTSVLNFAPTVLRVPADVDVRKVDLASELQILAFHAQRRAVRSTAAAPAPTAPAPTATASVPALQRSRRPALGATGPVLDRVGEVV
ncbi:redox-sensing transcriptional repressor [Kineococcus radiotolerans]|uniref:Redox-sensing transcriptional repressor Rex n=1 Tax=Kineococcus radiotolerans TaxID=131568 RepID=A0A7W4TLM0_KINRA|nr:redox-sensing transcriptional repressor Rex [Kineococcus radiotolerans]MBB2900732.1 redox-sensing transcriptional repressor [Kineococcus radiotolerans]